MCIAKLDGYILDASIDCIFISPSPERQTKDEPHVSPPTPLRFTSVESPFSVEDEELLSEPLSSPRSALANRRATGSPPSPLTITTPCLPDCGSAREPAAALAKPAGACDAARVNASPALRDPDAYDVDATGCPNCGRAPNCAGGRAPNAGEGVWIGICTGAGGATAGLRGVCGAEYGLGLACALRGAGYGLGLSRAGRLCLLAPTWCPSSRRSGSMGTISSKARGGGLPLGSGLGLRMRSLVRVGALFFLPRTRGRLLPGPALKSSAQYLPWPGSVIGRGTWRKILLRERR